MFTAKSFTKVILILHKSTLYVRINLFFFLHNFNVLAELIPSEIK